MMIAVGCAVIPMLEFAGMAFRSVGGYRRGQGVQNPRSADGNCCGDMSCSRKALARGPSPGDLGQGNVVLVLVERFLRVVHGAHMFFLTSRA
jgi:hypothetical protein